MASKTAYKSFMYQFEPLKCTGLISEIYANIAPVINEGLSYWLHFEKPSKNLQQQLSKLFVLKKEVKAMLFAEEARSKCVMFAEGCLLILHCADLGDLVSDTYEYPTIRLWITSKGVLSISTGKIKALEEVQKTIPELNAPSALSCILHLIEAIMSHLEECVYQIDEDLSKIEAVFHYHEDEINRIMAIRQNVIFFRRFLFPQREVLINVSNKFEHFSDAQKAELKELNDTMLRLLEAIDMMRERSVIIQDNIANQIGEIANRRMYLLTIIMLIFTPAFFIMGLFSMYVPIPFMNDKSTWWVVLAVMLGVSWSLYYLFKKKKWI